MAFGFFLMRTHWLMWVRQQQEFIDDPRELRHLQNRFHRRVQTSGLIAFVGLLIPLADLPLVWNQGPLLPTILWIGIVGVILLAGPWSASAMPGADFEASCAIPARNAS